MTKILVTYDMFREGFAELVGKYDVTFPDEKGFSYEQVFEMIPQYDVLCPMFDFPVNKELMDRAENLKLVANYAVGYDNIDIPYAIKKGIVVANTPGPVTAPTANLALALMLDVARRVTESDRRFRKEGRSRKIGLLDNLGLAITGQVLGIIGMGRIGQALAKRAKACGMEVIYNNRRQLDLEAETRLGVEFVPFDELIERSDFISLNAPYTSESYHLIGENELGRMKPTAILINTARGPLVDERALVNALQNGVIRGAGLDVFEFGDYPSDELLELENVVLTSHIGTQTQQTRVEMARAVSDNVIGFLENDRPVSRVTPVIKW